MIGKSVLMLPTGDLLTNSMKLLQDEVRGNGPLCRHLGFS